MHVHPNFKTKKEFKVAVEAWNEYAKNPDGWVLRNAAPSSIVAVMGVKRPRQVTYYQPGPFGGNEVRTGTIYVEGPHEYHKWYAQCTVKDGVIIKVK